MVSRFGVPDLGIGVGYRVPHYREVVDDRPSMDWFELLSENFMVDGGSPRRWQEAVCALYPCVLHGVSMSLGSEGESGAPRAAAGARPIGWSPRGSRTTCAGRARRAVRVNDLLPVPYTPAMRDHIVDRIKEVQDRLGRVFAVENVSSYLTYRDSVMTEWDFLVEVLERADCALLLDVNNVFVSSVNHGFDPIEYLDAMPADRVVQIHLAGHSVMDGLPARHPRPSGLRRGLGPVSARHSPDWLGLDPHRVGRRHPHLRATHRRGRDRPRPP